MGNTIIEDILNDIETLLNDTDVSTVNKIAKNSCDLINVLIYNSIINDGILNLCSVLNNFIKKSKEKQIQLYHKNTINYLENFSNDESIMKLIKVLN
jgi:hypothetical protein